jgi:hypothetical protein
MRDDMGGYGQLQGWMMCGVDASATQKARKIAQQGLVTGSQFRVVILFEPGQKELMIQALKEGLRPVFVFGAEGYLDGTFDDLSSSV